MRLANKAAVITGAGSGIGLAAARLFVREGAQVVGGVYEPGDDAAIEGIAVPVRGDVSREEDAARLIRTAVERFGGLDILVNNAGIESPGTVTETTDEQWERMLDVNLKSVYLCSKHAVPEMLRRGGGAIVNTASINGIRGNHRLVAYSASKGGVVAMTMAMALDYADKNIRVNCVCPAAIEQTRMMERSIARQPDPERQRQYLIAKHPMGRLGRPEEVAAAILFLASDEASYISGVALPVDGARSIR
jgi:NAD(P)-dependent dehydrogenase (short-subunit alcohol dehydrogenase family)